MLKSRPKFPSTFFDLVMQQKTIDMLNEFFVAPVVVAAA
jgi:hypothetical protein